MVGSKWRKAIGEDKWKVQSFLVSENSPVGHIGFQNMASSICNMGIPLLLSTCWVGRSHWAAQPPPSPAMPCFVSVPAITVSYIGSCIFLTNDIGNSNPFSFSLLLGEDADPLPRGICVCHMSHLSTVLEDRLK